MVRVQIMSDLHIEYKNDDIPNVEDYIIPTAEVLILAGDIGSLYKYNQLQSFLKKICEKFKIVLYIPGNHEFYMQENYTPKTMSVLNGRLKTLEEGIENLHILNGKSVVIEDFCIAGCTLWTNPQCTIPKFLSRIYNVNTRKYKKMHELDLQYVNRIINYCNEKKYKLTLITHHPPSFRTLEGSRKRRRFESLYASELDYLLDKDSIKNWICGHTHANFDFYSEKGTRVISNQKGKPRDKIRSFSRNCTIEL